MSGTTMADKVFGLDESLLERIVSRLTGECGGTIGSWTCHPMGSLDGNFVTDGVFRVEGWSETSAGPIPWSVVVKMIRPDRARDDSAHYNYWRREALVYGSGLLESLPGGLSTPLCYGTEEKDDGSVWLWLEDIADDGAPWGEAEFAFAARQLGRFQGAYLTGEPLPDHAWLNRAWLKSWVLQSRLHQPAVSPEAADSAVKLYGLGQLLKTYQDFSQTIDRWVDALGRLPRTLAHQDYYKNNLILLRSPSDQSPLGLTALDWQFASLSGIGEDLGRFFGLTMTKGQIPVSDFGRYGELLFEWYLDGLRDAGWRGDERLPRMGFLASCAIRSVWEVPKLIHKASAEDHRVSDGLQQPKESVERLIRITQQQMEMARQLSGLSGLL
ncbi:aminoglycoside phosphotransferase [Paenibacillus caseinilyticus]|uniref:Aminoglycoside phosphotransferase n=1 Tax=Paenibacillus mucilaginosus K02 TaxID=997761 RepID=I0BDN7_9BACL|nr:aminoglycoside phosphotransferase [Paenibacillus mucilaginosus]AFH60484.1 aminoglycoside phosphotransferase [Paenibacillus mucilaginosus K02]